MGWRNTLCFVSCAALAVVSSKVEGKVSRSNSIPLKCHCTLTRGKQPKNTLWDPLPAIYGWQCAAEKHFNGQKQKVKVDKNNWQKHKNKITGSFAQNLLYRIVKTVKAHLSLVPYMTWLTWPSKSSDCRGSSNFMSVIFLIMSCIQSGQCSFVMPPVIMLMDDENVFLEASIVNFLKSSPSASMLKLQELAQLRPL